MRLGFDEVYVLVEDGSNIYNQCIYDSSTAKTRVKELRDAGFTDAGMVTLEAAIERYNIKID